MSDRPNVPDDAVAAAYLRLNWNAPEGSPMISRPLVREALEAALPHLTCGQAGVRCRIVDVVYPEADPVPLDDEWSA